MKKQHFRNSVSKKYNNLLHCPTFHKTTTFGNRWKRGTRHAQTQNAFQKQVFLGMRKQNRMKRLKKKKKKQLSTKFQTAKNYKKKRR